MAILKWFLMSFACCVLLLNLQQHAGADFPDLETTGAEWDAFGREVKPAAYHEPRRIDAANGESVAHGVVEGVIPAGFICPKCGAECECGPKTRKVPVVAEEGLPCCPDEKESKERVLHFFVDYDNGFVIRPFHPEKHPFELKINSWIQFRHHAFVRNVDSWTDNAGITRPVRNRNAWDIERGRLILSGYALDQRLTYFLQMDGDTDGGETVDFFDYWWGWEFSEHFQFRMGKSKVPASRQWLLSARNTRFVDRPMANDFFRPDRTTGLFGSGKIGELAYYQVMAGNGYRTANLPPSSTDNRISFAGTTYWDPFGDFGRELVDYDFSETPLVRVGHSAVFSPQASLMTGTPLDEADFVRLADGTRLTEFGALAPGVTVSQFDVFLYGVDFAAKWQGWSFDTEVFFRWIEDIEGNGPLPRTSVFQWGYYVEGGRFLIEKKLDANLRYSQVSGVYGNASEYAIGCNWYPWDTTKLKLSFDTTYVTGSPLQNTASDILVGDDGVLFRTQFQAEY